MALRMMMFNGAQDCEVEYYDVEDDDDKGGRR